VKVVSWSKVRLHILMEVSMLVESYRDAKIRIIVTVCLFLQLVSRARFSSTFDSHYGSVISSRSFACLDNNCIHMCSRKIEME